MKKKYLLLITALLISSFSFQGCENSEAAETAGTEPASAEIISTSEASTEINSTEAASTSPLIGQYMIDGADGTYYSFEDDEICHYVQHGTYTKDSDSTISITLDALDSATEYQISSEDDTRYLTTTASGAESETIIPLTFMEGTDGLNGTDSFFGIYYSSTDIYRYEFYEDNSFFLVIDQTYQLNEEKNEITFNAFDNALTYSYRIESNDNLVLYIDDTIIAVLMPM